MTLTIGKTVLQTINTSAGIKGFAAASNSLLARTTAVDDTPEMEFFADGDQHA
jgi:hypothetical protein